ncbi:hypothetical protein [Aestuariivirga sp.]|uniref:hypothetical protein n=1 Tax=Aestuariivirga sp. TaxID=2650926 RepID=UPI0039E5D19F
MDDFENRLGQLLDRIDLSDWNSVLALAGIQPDGAELRNFETKKARVIESPATLMNTKGSIVLSQELDDTSCNELLFFISPEDQPRFDLGKASGVLRDTKFMKSKKGGVSFSGTIRQVDFSVLSDSDEQAPFFKISGIIVR